MAADTFFGNRAILTVTGTSPTAYPTVQTIAVLKGIEINVTFEHVELYGMDSVLRQDVAKHTGKVEVKVRFAKFDPTIASSTYFPYWILTPGSSASPAVDSTGIENTNTEKLFTVTAQVTGTGGMIMKATITNVYFERFPMPLPENDFVVMDLTGYGSNVTFANA